MLTWKRCINGTNIKSLSLVVFLRSLRGWNYPIFNTTRKFLDCHIVQKFQLLNDEYNGSHSSDRDCSGEYFYDDNDFSDDDDFYDNDSNYMNMEFLRMISCLVDMLNCRHLTSLEVFFPPRFIVTSECSINVEITFKGRYVFK